MDSTTKGLTTPGRQYYLPNKALPSMAYRLGSGCRDLSVLFKLEAFRNQTFDLTVIPLN